MAVYTVIPAKRPNGRVTVTLPEALSVPQRPLPEPATPSPAIVKPGADGKPSGPNPCLDGR